MQNNHAFLSYLVFSGLKRQLSLYINIVEEYTSGVLEQFRRNNCSCQKKKKKTGWMSTLLLLTLIFLAIKKKIPTILTKRKPLGLNYSDTHKCLLITPQKVLVALIQRIPKLTDCSKILVLTKTLLKWLYIIWLEAYTYYKVTKCNF